MPTRNVVLTDHQSTLVDQLVQSGRYQNASEVLREGLRLVEREATLEAAKLAALREAAAIGMADVDAGRFVDFASPDALADHLARLTDEALSGASASSSTA